MKPRYTPQTQPLPWTHADTAHFENCTAWARAEARQRPQRKPAPKRVQRRPLLSFWGLFR